MREVNNQFHIGVAGRARFGDILHYADVPAIHDADFETDFDVRGWLVTKAVPAWIAALKESEEEHLDKEDWADGVALVVIKNRIFAIGPDFSVLECQEFGGIGSGAYYARGAMAAGANVEKALTIAAELDPFTGGQLNVKKGVK